jgi:hypothetical protein
MKDVRKSGTEGAGKAGAPGLKNQSKYLLVLLAAVALVIIMTAAMLLGGDAGVPAPPDKAKELSVEDRLQLCVEGNPSLSEEMCMDIAYHETAIIEGDKELCGRIQSERIREHCLSYLGFEG